MVLSLPCSSERREVGLSRREGSGEIRDEEESGGAIEPLVFGEALLDDRHAHYWCRPLSSK